ncbi:MAG: BrnT family toxin [bacterium]|nr:BrnT family toxin [bacterium]
MRFEWDADKSNANKGKHGIDFERAKNIWLDENRVEICAPHPVEDRSIIIGEVYNKLWTAIYTMREDTVRIISVRRAREKEARLYEKEKVS